MCNVGSRPCLLFGAHDGVIRGPHPAKLMSDRASCFHYGPLGRTKNKGRLKEL